MNKKEVAEIKRRFKKETCSFQRMAGCYVNSEKAKLLQFSQSFLNQEDEELHKHLELANKALSGTVGNQLLTLEFPLEEEALGGHQQLLMALRASKLEDEGLLSAFYDQVIDHYDYVGNYLITLYYDIYDIPLKTSDNLALDESEEVYEYLLCCICPVALSKAGLGYLEQENRIGARIRDWVVGATESAFLFPAFNDRGADIHATLVYSKKPAEPHTELWDGALGCPIKRTSTQKQQAFTHMIQQAVGAESDEAKETLLDVQQSLNDYILLEMETVGKDDAIPLSPATVTELLTEGGVPENKADRIASTYEGYFGEEIPDAKELLDTRAIKSNEVRVEKKHLQEKVVELTSQLEEAGVINADGSKVDIAIKVSQGKAQEITTAYIDGKKCIVIPLGEADEAKVNGQEFQL